MLQGCQKNLRFELKIVEGREPRNPKNLKLKWSNI